MTYLPSRKFLQYIHFSSDQFWNVCAGPLLVFSCAVLPRRPVPDEVDLAEAAAAQLLDHPELVPQCWQWPAVRLRIHFYEKLKSERNSYSISGIHKQKKCRLQNHLTEVAHPGRKSRGGGTWCFLPKSLGGVKAFRKNCLGGSPYFGFYCIFINKCFEICLRGVLYLPSPLPPTSPPSLCASMVARVQLLSMMSDLKAKPCQSKQRRFKRICPFLYPPLNEGSSQKNGGSEFVTFWLKIGFSKMWLFKTFNKCVKHSSCALLGKLQIIIIKTSLFQHNRCETKNVKITELLLKICKEYYYNSYQVFVLLFFKGIETMNNDCTWVFNFHCISNFQYESFKRVHPFVITSFCDYILLWVHLCNSLYFPTKKQTLYFEINLFKMVS